MAYYEPSSHDDELVDFLETGMQYHDQEALDRAAVRTRQPMQTVLGNFCEELEQAVRPLLEPINRAADALSAARQLPTQSILPTLREIADQFALLVYKIADQQAYVLIFGPLKSGKSTFMNSLCARYVSEVTCLPAYPCLVQVSHAETPHYVVTRYNGASETFTEPEEVRQALESDHRKLVETIRKCEAEGVDFEPQRHASDAIRRVDVKVPAGDLAKSSTVLVDTPGLYSRMKFGYDRMTRDSRDAAACAIFVVKTDNLFLDQVFEEFQDLLELFSRIFLIVNLDANKQDLQADGSLKPSLEHEDPQAVVRAFENLSMSASLKEAREDGRLRIYPVDLLGAASRRIRMGQNGEDPGAIEDEPRGQADFDVLLEDLTHYLNSNEYLRSFVNDSLRRATNLLDELSELFSHEGVEKLQVEMDVLHTAQEEMQRRTAAIKRLRDIDWAEPLTVRREALCQAVRDSAEPIQRNCSNALAGALDAWFDNDTSLASLLQRDVVPTLQRARDDFLKLIRDELNQRFSADQGVPETVRDDLATLEIQWQAAVRTALDGLKLEDKLPVPVPDLQIDEIPVRRAFPDWLLFRRKASVGKHLFGLAEQPQNPIPPSVKAKRLGDEGRDMIRTRLGAALDQLTKRVSDSLPAESFDTFGAELTERLTEALGESESAAKERLRVIQAALTEMAGVRERLNELQGRAEQVSAAVVRIGNAFGDQALAVVDVTAEQEITLLSVEDDA